MHIIVIALIYDVSKIKKNLPTKATILCSMVELFIEHLSKIQQPGR